VFLRTHYAVGGTFRMPGQEQDRGDFKLLGSQHRETRLTATMISAEEQGVANAVAGLPTSRFTSINSKDQPTTVVSNGVKGNSRRGSSSENSYQSYTILSSTKQTPTTATSKSYKTREEDLREQPRPEPRDSHVPEAQYV
jgi:hypothetical protein